MSKRKKLEELDPDVANAADMNMAQLILRRKAEEKELNECVFCQAWKRSYGEARINGKIFRVSIITDTEDFFLMHDLYPVVQGHLLIITKKHLRTGCLELPEIAWLQIPQLITAGLNMTKHYDSSVEGFNFGHNSGEVAGQTVMHCHFHLFPRRKGDVKNPRGGIRNFKTPIVPY